MKRMHVHVSVRDIDRSVSFYSALFATEPAVVKADYAKWMLDDPRINFAISTRGREAGLDHLGIQVETEGETATGLWTASPSRRQHPGGRQDDVLLRQFGKIMDRGSGRHRLGSLLHHRR